MLGKAELFVSPALTSKVTPACRSRTKTSATPLVSLATRSDATLSNTTQRPSGVTAGFKEGPLPLTTPLVLILTSVVVAANRSRRNTSVVPFVSTPARLLAALSKATNWPLEEMVGKLELPSPPPAPD